MSNFLQNTKSDYFSIVDPIAFEKLSDLKNAMLYDSIKNTVGSSITEIFNRTIAGSSAFDTDVGNISSIVGNIASNILEQNNISQDSFSFYKFRINPQKLRVSRRKIIDEKYTGAGWDLDTVNEEMITMSYEGTTGSLVPYNFFNKTVEPLLRSLLSQFSLGGTIGVAYDSYVDIPMLSRNPKLSGAYIKFLNFEQFWKYNNNDLLFIWEDNCYVGKFIDFSYNISEKEPYQIMWSFSIKVYPDFTYNLYTGYLDDEQYSQIQQTFNKRFKSINIIDSGNQDPLTTLQNLGGRRTDGNDARLTSTEQDGIDWFSNLGKSIYNKDNILYSLNRTRNLGIDLSKINPRQLAELYKHNSNIDLFEDSISFNLNQSAKETEINEQQLNQVNKNLIDDYVERETQNELLQEP